MAGHKVRAYLHRWNEDGNVLLKKKPLWALLCQDGKGDWGIEILLEHFDKKLGTYYGIWIPFKQLKRLPTKPRQGK